jgi:AcrR family transcriptional regulator
MCKPTLPDGGRALPYGGRMPRDTLTREQIISAAIDLLDRDGLEGLNMRALGRRLGSAATAVYWHVGSKESLLALAADQAWNEVTLPDLAATGWRDAATAMATGLHAMLTRHPWVVQAFGSFLVYGPGKARHDNHTLALYEAAGFSAAQAGQAAATVFTFVFGNALGTAAAASLARKLGRDHGDAEELIRDHVAKATQIAAQFPQLRARLGQAEADYGATPEGSFEFGLGAILDGLEARLADAGPPAGPGLAAAGPPAASPLPEVTQGC